MRAKPVPSDRFQAVFRAPVAPVAGLRSQDADRAATAALLSDPPVHHEGRQRVAQFVSLAGGWMSLAAGYALLVWIVGRVG